MQADPAHSLEVLWEVHVPQQTGSRQVRPSVLSLRRVSFMTRGVPQGMSENSAGRVSARRSARSRRLPPE